MLSESDAGSKTLQSTFSTSRSKDQKEPGNVLVVRERSFTEDWRSRIRHINTMHTPREMDRWNFLTTLVRPATERKKDE